MAISEEVKILFSTADAAKSVRDLKTSLRDLKSAALEAGEGSEAFNKITQKAGELNDRITRVNENIRANTGSAIENAAKGFANIASVGAGAFSTIQGAAALFGNESKDLQATLVKLNAAVALTSGLKALADAPDIINDAAKAITTFALGTEGATLSLKSMRGALIATGLGVFVVALGFAIDYFTSLSNATDDATDSLLDYGKATENAAEKTADELVQLQSLLVVAKDETKSKSDRTKAIKELNELSPKYLGNLTLETINTDAATAATKLYTEALLKNAKAIAAKDILADIEKQILLSQDADKIGKSLFDSQQRLSLGITESEQKFRQSQGTLVGYIDTATSFATKKTDLLKVINENTVDFGTKTAAAATKATEKTDKLDISFKQFGETTTSVTAKGIENLDGYLFAYDKYSKDIIAASYEVAATQIENDKKVAEEKQASIQKGFAVAEAGANALNSLNELLNSQETQRLKKGEKLSIEIQKKQFARQKALGLVNAAISGAEAIVKSLTIDPTGILASIIGITTGIQIAAIAAKKFNPESPTSDTSSGPGVAGGSLPSAPTTPSATALFGTAGAGNTGGGGNGGNGDAVRVFVVESDITNAQRSVDEARGEIRIGND